ncbi:glycine betaine ABC transporter substrate-binding protein [Dichotomicrobium thermohalophilum]|uniref:Osmoprotectant transport system substrate-binding protein n=1 Tax=Dichotomicrobium thermohalophilum TaxID=933063 RepID=A0A397Q8M2_9HYPH|nr:glycine betaine ABC transporter substrate-binding protein [Dichotomicrobium thermohalophilum]RIA56869.1 osmoprotectant transport system substrate-binding protein [Dichotomicrobium thermohalophilum]
MMRIFKTFAVAILALVFAAGTAAAQTITVGGKGFTEQLLMAEMTAQLLEANGYDVDKRDGLGSTVLRQAQENGQVDVYWEYTGTSLVVYNKVEERMSPEETYNTVKELDAEKGLVWLEPSDANNTYALAMNRDEAEEMGIDTIEDLKAKLEEGAELSFAVNAEFPRREDGLIGLQKEYDFTYPRGLLNSMESGLTYQALNEDRVDVALVFATDGRIAAFDFVTLEDNRNFFPHYALTPVIRKETLDANPELADILNGLSAQLSDEVMRQLNAAVDMEKKTIEDVAANFLKEEGLI